MSANSDFELPKSIGRYLAAVAKLYAREGKKRLEQIVVNAQVRVHEEWSYDSWDGGIYGHALYLVIPEQLFLAVAKQKTSIQEQIKKDLNTVHNVQNEFVAQVFLEMALTEDRDWRKESGLLVTGIRPVSPDSTKRVWQDDGFRLFLSHKSEVKKETADLASRLNSFGMSCFVAHKDIKPTKAWQDEIENALNTMEGFVALMTGGFHDSDWTDQEVGFALARGVPIIAVCLGLNPYGFIGKFQGLSCGWNDAATEITRLLINDPRMQEAYIMAVRNCSSFDMGNKLAELLPSIEAMDDGRLQRLVDAQNENGQARYSYGFNGSVPYKYGQGLIHHLHRLGKRRFRSTDEERIEPVG